MDGPSFNGEIKSTVYTNTSESKRRASSQASIERTKGNKKRQKELESKGWKTLTWIAGKVWVAIGQRKHQTEVEKAVADVVKEKGYPTEKAGNPRYVSGDVIPDIMEEVKRRIGIKKR